MLDFAIAHVYSVAGPDLKSGPNKNTEYGEDLMKVWYVVIASVLCVCVLSGVPASCDAQKVTWEVYQAYNISVEISSPHDSFNPSKTPGSLMDEGYLSGGLAYDVIVAPIAPALRSKAALDDYLNQMLGLTNRIQQAIASRHPSEKWNVSAKNGKEFTGITIDDFIMDPSFDKIASDHKASISMAIAALKSDYSQCLLVSVAGPRDRRSEIEAAAKAMAQSVDNASSEASQAATPPELRPDQIELIGVVKSISLRSKSLVMNVDTVNTRDQGSITLNPPRSKTVFASGFPKRIMVGSRLKVVGRNSGVGKPVRADVLLLMAPVVAPLLRPNRSYESRKT